MFSYLEIQGFIKSLFTKVYKERSKSFMYLAGAITDGTYRLEVRVQQEDEGLTYLKKFEKIEIKERMNYEGRQINIID